MMRRIASVVVGAAVLLVGTTSCPSGGQCPVMKQAAHDCCRAAEAIRTADCCDEAAGLVRALGTHRAADPAVATASSVTALAAVAPCVTLVAHAPSITTGLAPPGTLTALHTSLLL